MAEDIILQDRAQELQDLPDPTIKMPSYRPAFNPGFERSAGDQAVYDANEDKKAASLGVVDTFTRALRSGDNVAVQIAKMYDRAGESGPVDPSWRNGNGEKWAKEKGITDGQRWRYTSTRNQNEAEAMLIDAKSQAYDQEVLSRKHGVGNFVARGLAGVIDVDAPVTFMTGGLTATGLAALRASKLAGVAMGAVGGAATGAGLGAAGYVADPNGEWANIPIAGLGGMAFGAIGGAFGRSSSHDAMQVRADTLDEFGSTLVDGAPRANENMHTSSFENTDNYFSQAVETEINAFRDLQAAAEKDIKANPSMAEGAERDLTNYNNLLNGAHEDLNAFRALREKAEADLGVRKPTSFDPSSIEGDLPDEAINNPHLDPDKGRASIGARQLNTNGPGIASIQSTRVQDMITNARARVKQLNLATDWLDGWANLSGKAGAVGKYAERFHNVLSHSPLSSDFAKLMNSGSAVAQTLAYDVFENASGIIRNGKSSARIMDHYNKELMSRFTPFHDAFEEYAGQAGAGWWQKQWDLDLKNKFNREVAAEMMARQYDGKGVAIGAVKKAADALDEVYAHELRVVKGRPGEMSVNGTDTIQQKSGYIQQKWLGRNIRNMVDSGRYTYAQVAESIAESYQRQYPTMQLSDAMIYAKAVVDRARNQDLGINTSMVSVLAGDGRAAVADMLTRNGFTPKQVEDFLTRITGAVEERQRAGHFKHRLDVDLRDTSSHGISMMDLVDTDFATMIPARMRRSAGQAALARKGIRSKADRDAIKEAILKEQSANGASVKTGTTIGEKLDEAINADKHIDGEFIDNLFSYFGEGPIAGGLGPMYSRMKKITNLALLNQLGLTNLAELGPTIASVGVSNFFRHAGEAFNGMLRNTDSELVKELKHMSILVPEERLFRDDLTHEFEKATTSNEYLRGFDRLLNKAQRLQGYTSGFYQVRNFQQRIAVTSAADRLAKHFRDGGLISDERLRDMGFDQNMMQKFSDYIKNGTVEFDADGNLYKLNMSKWDPSDADQFAYTLNAQVNTLVQKAMAGESTMLFHKDGVASLFWHLKSFGMLALEKQALRQTRFMDKELAAQFAYGLGTAAAVYVTKQTINGRDDKLDPIDIAKGAFGQSNLTGWIPMWTDPLAGMLGLEDLRVGGYQGMNETILSTPAALPTINRIANIPGLVTHAATGQLSTRDINALTATPIIGNAYGFAYIFNAMKDALKN
ncbi:putative internal virion protein [Rhizobium phage RHph_I40]|uniref:Putative internal virion protein n=1 Tax=Rhizobium phage RHph_I38 TaxID=2509734 RepID=A0A7S5UY70_9CAUD|nr:putative internal virion protein [Rhizobium phage RHph_I38]QXV73671.1 putative internal virion protein [Rhizobium phage RHph_I40]